MKKYKLRSKENAHRSEEFQDLLFEIMEEKRIGKDLKIINEGEYGIILKGLNMEDRVRAFKA